MEPRIPIGLYATVVTALGARIAQSSVLEAAGLTEDEWQRESAAWNRVLLALIEDDDASSLGPHDEAIVAARDRLSRSVEPLDSDVAAWLSFQSAWVSAPDPTAFLHERGLTSLDMMRIATSWSGRFAGDEPLRMAALGCMGRKAAPVPEVRIGPWALDSAFAGLWDREKSIVPETTPEPALPVAPADEEPSLWTALPGKPAVTEPVTEAPRVSGQTLGPPRRQAVST